MKMIIKNGIRNITYTDTKTYTRRGRFKKVIQRYFDCIIEKYDSIDEFLRLLNKMPVKETWQNGYKYSTEKMQHNPNWFGGLDNRADAKLLMSHGWKDVIDKVNDVFTTVPKVAKPCMTHDYVGFSPCVPRALQGHPKSMYSYRSTKPTNKVISITYNNCANGGISGDKMLQAGKNICSTVIALEEKGYRVQLNTLSFTSNNEDNKNLNAILIAIKKANQPINLDAIMFPLAHPAFLRAIIFEYDEKTPYTPKYESGYGIAVTTSNDVWVDRQGKEMTVEQLLDEQVVICYDDAKQGVNYLMDLIEGKLQAKK